MAKAAARGIGCKGPFPSDTVFLKAFNGDFDGVLSMYHDQGQIATKLKGFNRGVTVTAGLATVFTTRRDRGARLTTTPSCAAEPTLDAPSESWYQPK